MSAIVTDRFRLSKTRSFFDAINDGVDLLYMTIGKSTEWPVEATPPTPNVSYEDELTARHSIQSAKKMTELAYCVPRYDWTSGNTYIAYDDEDQNLSTKQFYVFNSSTFSVYICLKAGSGASTVEPTSTATTVPTALADGYIWKYLYTITASQATKFLTTDYIPVFRDSAVAAAAVEGAIHNITIEDGGSGYGSAPTITITGDGMGATATASITSGVVTGITITNVGSGYTYAKIAVSSGNASLRAVLAPKALGREIQSITIDNAGADYTNVTDGAVTVTGDGNSASLTATTSGGTFDSFTVTDGGYNYTRAAVTPDPDEFAVGTTEALFTVNFSAKKGGFGYDPIVELKAYFVMIHTTLESNTETGFFVDNDFRQICLIKNPLTTETNPEAYTATAGVVCQVINVASSGTFVVDELLTGATSGAKGYIVNYDSDNDLLYFYQDETTGFGTFSAAETLSGSTSTGTSGDPVYTTDATKFDRNTGEMLYLENRVAVTRNEDQTEDLKLVIQF